MTENDETILHLNNKLADCKKDLLWAMNEKTKVEQMRDALAIRSARQAAIMKHFNIRTHASGIGESDEEWLAARLAAERKATLERVMKCRPPNGGTFSDDAGRWADAIEREFQTERGEGEE